MHVLHRGIKQLNNFLPHTNHWLILVASVPVSLSTGTLFVYSVYGTQLAERCQLDASQTANLNISATIGTAFGSVLGGLVTDIYGTQIPMLISCFSISLGYAWVYAQYLKGPDSSVLQLLSAMFLVGIGSVAGYFSSIKAVTINFPNFKGTAQSITIASFAISSLLFSYIATHTFHGDVGQFLHFLSIACGLSIFIGFIFIRVDGHIDAIHHQHEIEESRSTPLETDALLSETPSVGDETEVEDETKFQPSDLKHLGLKESFLHPTFWYHYLIFAIVQGLGQMYIYSVGFVLKAVHYYYTNVLVETTGPIPSLNSLQALHVSIIAIASFIGRLSSGPQSDYLVHKLHSQRHWVLILGLGLMLTGHLLNSVKIDSISTDLNTVNIYLSVVSALIGYAYGFSFTSYPAIISDLFDMRNYSFIWGAMYTATTFGLTVMTKIFGFIYDTNSDHWDDAAHDYVCAKGSGCYNTTFEITSGLSVFAIILILGYIYERNSRPKRVETAQIA
ncbi:permease [Scheffersomyces xylosifermentans]|uniref:permease n=1 Tax=Scheffersomyces xylosifermentans TaxID=1304137 RepID=UPI00315D30EC